MSLKKIYNSLSFLKAIESINTITRNVLLAKMAYVQGSIGLEVVEQMEKIFDLVSKNVLDSLIDKKEKKILGEIIIDIKRGF